MNIKIILDNVTSFFMDPSNDNRKPAIQGLAWVSTIILGVLTIGIGHGLSALWRHLRHIDKNQTHEKIAGLFRQVFSNVSPSPSRLSSFQELAENIYNNREELWNAALREVNGNQSHAMTCFIKKIRSEFKKNGKSLSAISSDSNALKIFFKSYRLRLALVNYARNNNLQNLLDKHLVFLAQDIYDKRDDYTGLASKTGNFTDQLIHLNIIIQTFLKNEGRSLLEVFNNNDSLEIFKKSNRLMIVLSFYAEMKKASQQNPSSKKNHRELENQQVKEAVRLGKNNAQGPGFVTRLGLNEFESNEEQLRERLKNFLRFNHPDKNPDADQKLVQDANQLLDMIRNGVYAHYKAALEKYRNEQKKVLGERGGV